MISASAMLSWLVGGAQGVKFSLVWVNCLGVGGWDISCLVFMIGTVWQGGRSKWVQISSVGK